MFGNFPLMVVSFAIYNMVVFLTPGVGWSEPLYTIQMMSGAAWSVTSGDALIACRMGLSVTRDARSVGAHTTSTVVQSLVAIIILNAIFAVMFVKLGI